MEKRGKLLNRTGGKKLVIGLLLLTMLTALLCGSAAASEVIDSGICGDNLTWTLDEDGTLTIRGTGAMYDYLGRDMPWDAHSYSITELVIDEGVTTIGDHAFYFCEKIAGELGLPDSLISIGAGAFWGCEDLNRIIIPKNVTHIGDNAFSYNSGLTDIVVEEGNLTYAAENGLLFDKSMQTLICCPGGKSGKVIVPDGVLSIGQAFRNCSAISEIVLPEGIETIETNAFAGCYELEKLNIPGSVRTMAPSVFDSPVFSSGKLVSAGPIGSGCNIEYGWTETIPEYAFFWSALEEVIIADGISRIGAQAFSYCSNLEEVTIPASVWSLGSWVFSDCTSLEIITFEGDAPTGLVINPFDGVTATCYYPADNTTWTDGVKTNLGSNITGGKLTWIEIDREWSSEDFEIIGAFGEGYRMFIKNIPVGESIELKVKNLRDETIVEDVEWEFREDIFMISDGNLTAIAPAIGVICAKVKIDGKTITVYSPEIAAYSTSGFCGAQNDGKNLRWEINAAESELTISGQGPMADYISVYSYDGGEFNSAPWYPYFYGVQNGLRIVVEEGVTSIGENAFYTFYGTMVGSIELPDSITDIEQSAIGYCVVLNNMLPANLHTVGSHAIFRVKDDVVYVPAGVSYLADSAFANMEDGTFCFGECEFSEAYFCGDAPAFVGDNVFGKNKEDIIIYYIEGTNGWIDSEHYNVDAGTWHGYKLEIWDTGGGDILPLKPVVSFTTDFATTATEFIEGDYIYPKLEVDENVDHYNSYWERLEDGEYVSYAVFEPDPAYSLQGMTGYGYPIWAFDEGWYRYRVQAVDSAGNAVYSDWTSFEVKPFEPRVPVTTIEIEGGAVLTPGEIAEVEVVITPPDADYRAIEWRSEDYSIVNVQPDSTSVGLTRATVTALQPGTTQIYAYTKDGDFAAALSICVTSASGTACGDNLTWSFDENTGTLTISGTGDMWDYDYLNGYAPLWGRYGDAIKRVVIENGVTSIGKDAFFNCEGLMTVEIPDSVTSVGEQAFFLCSRMTSIDLPNTLTAIDYGAFSHSGLTEVAIPAGVDYLGDDAFYGCSNLSTVAIANGVKSIGGLAFYECPALRSIDIPESVTFIGPAAFYGCSSLGSIDLPEGITAISDGTFYLCESLKSIDIPDNVTSIGFSAFAFCLELADIELPENLVVIDNDAFFFCPVLASITIPSGVTSIGNYAFEYCYSLQLIEFLGDAPSFGEETFAYVTATCLYPAGNATWTDDVMQSYGGYIGWVPVYEVLEGANSTVDTDKGEDVSIRTSGECAEFVALYVDDEAVAPENYTVTEGSTIITFKAEYLASLEDGEHFVVMYFQKGMATTTLTTRKSDYIDVPDGCAMIILAGYNGSGMLVDYKILDADVPEEDVGGDEVWAYFLDGNYVPLCAKKQLR